MTENDVRVKTNERISDADREEAISKLELARKELMTAYNIVGEAIKKITPEMTYGEYADMADEVESQFAEFKIVEVG